MIRFLALILATLTIWSNAQSQSERICEDGQRSYFGVCPEDNATRPPSPPPKDDPAKETVDHDAEAWKSAEKCGTAACFEAYLADYPQGRYAKLAQAQLLSNNRSSWNPKVAFDGRVGQIEFVNNSFYDVTVHLWHPDTKDFFMSFLIKKNSKSLLQYNNQPLNIGSDWGIQVGSKQSRVRTVMDVSEWKIDGNHYLWRITTDSFFN